MYPPKAEALDLNELVNEMAVLFRCLTRPAITFELVLHPEPLPILHDKFTTEDELLRRFCQARSMIYSEVPDRTGHIVLTTDRLILTPETALEISDLNTPPVGEYCSVVVTCTGWQGAPFDAYWPRAGQGTA